MSNSNLKTETIRFLEISKKTPADVRWVGSIDGLMALSWDDVITARCDHEGIGLPGCNTCDPMNRVHYAAPPAPASRIVVDPDHHVFVADPPPSPVLPSAGYYQTHPKA